MNKPVGRVFLGLLTSLRTFFPQMNPKQQQPNPQASNRIVSLPLENDQNLISQDFPGGPAVKNPPSTAGDVGFHPWLGN